MNIQIIEADGFETKNWSGGTSTELFIHPPSANYIAQNFDFRISTATVKTETSDFTVLPRHARKLMVLDGKTTLHHQDGRSITLSKFEVDAFDGALKTRSVGRCTDFNVMTNANWQSEVWAVSLHKDAVYTTTKINSYIFVYAFEGSATVLVENTTLLLSGKALLVATDVLQVSTMALQNCALVCVALSKV